jgi:hypothetical protein
VHQHGLVHVPCKTGPQCNDEELGRRGKGDASNGALTFHTHIVGSPCRGKQGFILCDTRTVRAVASDEQGRGRRGVVRTTRLRRGEPRAVVLGVRSIRASAVVEAQQQRVRNEGERTVARRARYGASPEPSIAVLEARRRLVQDGGARTVARRAHSGAIPKPRAWRGHGPSSRSMGGPSRAIAQ